jgi:hypothetical protein
MSVGTGNKTLKSINFLVPPISQSGSSRAFNNVGQFAWVASFTDKRSAIVITQLP